MHVSSYRHLAKYKLGLLKNHSESQPVTAAVTDLNFAGTQDAMAVTCPLSLWDHSEPKTYAGAGRLSGNGRLITSLMGNGRQK